MSSDTIDEAKSYADEEKMSPDTPNEVRHIPDEKNILETGRHELESNTSPLKRSAMRALVQDFSPLWFTWCMNSGILSILLHQLPYQFHGLHIIATILFLIDLVLFILFTLAFLARFIIFGKEAYFEIINDLSLLTLLACWPIAYLTLPPSIALIASQAPWGGHPWSLVSYILWWIGAFWTNITLLFVFTTLIRHHRAPDQRLPTTVIIPAVGVATLAATGGLVTINAVDLTPNLAVPVIIFSFMCVGVGFVMGMFLYTYLFHQLLTQSWPRPEQTASLFIFVGPMGQCATALQLLGASAKTYGNFEGYNHGSFFTAETAGPLYAACLLLALLFTGMGFIWLAFSVYAMIERACEGKLKWNPGWNAIIFPTGVLTTSTLEFGVEMDSGIWRVVTTVLVVFMVMVYLGNIVGTVWKISKGELLVVREDWRVKKRLEECEKLK